MSRSTDKSMSRSHGRRLARQALAATVTVAVNGAVVLMLSTWAGGQRPVRLRPLPSAPLNVMDVEPEDAPLVEADLSDDVPESAPVPSEPVLPVPPMPVAPAMPRLELPALAQGGAVQISAIASDLPDYDIEPVAPVVVAPPPRIVPPPKPAAPPKAAPARGPALLQPPDLSAYYPRRARMSGVTGKTTIRIRVGADGRAEDVQVLRSTPEGTFETAAKRVGHSLRFRPATRDGRSVPVTVSLNLVWNLEE